MNAAGAADLPGMSDATPPDPADEPGPAPAPARDRLDAAIGPELASRLVSALSADLLDRRPAKPPGSGTPPAPA